MIRDLVSSTVEENPDMSLREGSHHCSNELGVWTAYPESTPS